MAIHSFIQLVALSLLLAQLVKSQPGTDEGEAVQFKDCPEDILADSTRCNFPGIYYVNIDGDVCRTTVNSTVTGCSQAEVTFQLNTTLEEEEENEGQSRRGLRGTPSGCPTGGHPVIPTNPDPASSCYSYSIPLCEGGRHELTIVTVGGTDATKSTSCYDIKINNKTVPKVIYYNLLHEQVCPRTEVVIALKPNLELTELGIGKTETFQITEGEFNLTVCFSTCGNASGSLQVFSVSMAKLGSGPVKDCSREDETYSNCKHYNGTNPSICWGRGCQHLKGRERCITGTTSCEAKTYKTCICSHKFCDNLDTVECSPDSSILQNKLSCRRAKSYYIYHPKTACYSEEDSGNCHATATYAVNLHGKALTDQRGTQYIADADSGFRDPNRVREPKNECRKNMVGISHPQTIQLYSNVIVAYRHGKPDRHGLCIYYPVPICQNGEYMLTVKMTDGWYKKPHRRCTEVRLNYVPIMIHMDTIILAGNRTCVPVDVVLMFLAVDGDDKNPKSDYTLHLKGHVEPIKVWGGQMELKFCIGWECLDDDNPMISAFTLERLGPGTKKCKLAPG